jgi:hypothetical protein
MHRMATLLPSQSRPKDSYLGSMAIFLHQGLSGGSPNPRNTQSADHSWKCGPSLTEPDQLVLGVFPTDMYMKRMLQAESTKEVYELSTDISTSTRHESVQNDTDGPTCLQDRRWFPAFSYLSMLSMLAHLSCLKRT